MRREYAADYLLAAWPETFARRDHERVADHVQRLAQHAWLLDATDAELAALCSTDVETVRRERNRMARDYGLGRMLRHARDVAYALGDLRAPSEIIRAALDAFRESRLEAQRSREIEAIDAPHTRSEVSA